MFLSLTSLFPPHHTLPSSSYLQSSHLLLSLSISLASLHIPFLTQSLTFAASHASVSSPYKCFYLVFSLLGSFPSTGWGNFCLGSIHCLIYSPPNHLHAAFTDYFLLYFSIFVTVVLFSLYFTTLYTCVKSGQI